MDSSEISPLGLNPYANDPGAWGASLLTLAEMVLSVLNAAKPRSVAEVGAYAGDFTRLLLLWAENSGATVTAIDPAPQPELEDLAREHPELELVKETSLAALEHGKLTDALVLDGDHNYYTVSEELRKIADRTRAERKQLPLLLLHDVCWPHARRDDYHDPAQIPPEFLQPLANGGGLYPGESGLRDGGLPYRWPAAREGGPRNGVLTAVEDFVGGREELELRLVPAFYGLGVLWDRESEYSEELSRMLEPWDRHPMLARLEHNRVLHVASAQVQHHRAVLAEEQLVRQQELLERMLYSRAFGAAELFLRLRQRGRPAFSKSEIRRLLGRE